MKNYLNLMKIDFLNTFNKKKTLSGVIFFIIISLFLIGVIAYITVMSYFSAPLMKEIGATGLIFSLLAVVSTFLTLMTATRIMSSGLFDANDYEMLSSLPISSKSILLSKLTKVYIDSNTLSGILVYPILLGLGLGLKMPAIYYILTLLTFLLVPIVSMVIAAIISILFLKLTSRFAILKKISNILFLALYVIIFIPYFSFTMNTQKIENTIENFASTIGGLKNVISEKLTTYPFSSLIQRITLEQDINAFVIFMMINIAILILFIIIFSKVYKEVNLSLEDHAPKTNFKLSNSRQKPIIWSLIKKDIINFSGYSIVLMQSLMGGILSIVFAFSMLQGSFKDLLIDLSAQEDINFFGLGALAMVIFMSTIMPFTAFSISIEGKNFWILKSSPIKTSAIFKSKIYLSLLINIPLAVIALIVLKTQIDFNFQALIFYAIIFFLYLIIATNLTLYYNLLFPKMEWDNIARVVKSSGSAFASAISAFFQIGILVVSALMGIFILKLNFSNLCFLIILVELFLAAISLLLLNFHGKKLFRKISG